MPYYGNYGGGFLSGLPQVTKKLLTINVIMFLFTLVNQNFMVGTFAMFYPASRYFHFWQPITHMFMHGGWAHIFFNMYALVMFGTVVENSLGWKKFITFYFVTGLGAAALHTGVEWLETQYLLANGSTSAITAYAALCHTPTLGASGAIFGLMVGFAMLYPQSVMTLWFPPISMKAKWFVLIYVGIELVLGFTNTASGVAHFAHLGGALFGWLLLKWWKKTGRYYERERWI